MGFEFGVVESLEPVPALLSFIGVVVFIVFFDYLSGVLEYFIDKSPMYHKMIKMIYKELMLMGLVSLAIDMLVAGLGVEASDKIEPILGAIDFAHILLFYVTIFFVGTAIYLIITSLSMEAGYRELFAEKTTDLVKKVEEVYSSTINTFLFRQQFIPLSHTRDLVEFKLVHTIFYSTYALPAEFNFPGYLSGCFARFALKTINRSLSTYVVLVVLVLINYLKTAAGFGCIVSEGEGDDAAPDRRLSYAGTAHRYLLSNDECRAQTVSYFFFCGGLLVIFNLIVVFMSRLYKIRLLSFAGTANPDEFKDFLVFKSEQEKEERKQKRLKQMHHVERFDLNELRKEITDELNADEEGGDEEEEEFRAIALFIAGIFRFCMDLLSKIRLWIRVSLTKLFCPERLRHQLENRTKGSVFKEMEDEETGDSLDDGGAAVEINDSSSSRPKTSRQTSIKHSHSSNKFGAEAESKSGHHGHGHSSHGHGHGHAPTAGEPIRHRLKVHSAAKQKMKYNNKNSGNGSNASSPASLDRRQNSNASTSKRTYSQDGTYGPMSLDAHLLEAPHHQTIHHDATVSEQFHEYQHTHPHAAAGNGHHGSAALPSLLVPPPPPLHLQIGVASQQSANDIRASSETMHEVIEEAELYFHSIFLFEKPVLYFRSVELCIMFNCLYLSFWLTNMIVICYDANFSRGLAIIAQLGMLVPAIICSYSIGFITSTCAVLEAISELNIEVVKDVLDDMAEQQIVVDELRNKILAMASVGLRDVTEQKAFISRLFAEIDTDGSGCLDSDEFRDLLRKVHLTYNDQRYRLLFAAVDDSGNGLVSEEELQEFIFPRSMAATTPAAHHHHSGDGPSQVSDGDLIFCSVGSLEREETASKIRNSVVVVAVDGIRKRGSGI